MSLSVRLLTGLKGWLLGRRFDRCASSPDAAQEATFQRILRSRADTAFGQEHGFASIKTHEEWVRRLPVRDYEDHRPYINRMLAGEQNVLVPNDVLMYGTTSGTTCEPKLIPVTDEFKADISALTTLWVARAQRSHPGTLRRGIFTMVSPSVEGYTDSGRPVGSVSGLTRARMPWFFALSRFVSWSQIKEMKKRSFEIWMAMGWMSTP